ncbi:zinc finger, GRF-type containing protein [Tanacetum coccineum]
MVFCSCGRLAVIKTSWTDGHPGRRFYACPIQGPCCRWIDWVDPPMCPRSIQIIPGLLRARNRHEASIQELTNEVSKLKKLVNLTIESQTSSKSRVLYTG